MRLGFACTWDPVPESTWSGTAWQLREALRRRSGPGLEVRDLGITLHPAERLAWRAAYARRSGGAWRSSPRWSQGWDRATTRRLSRACGRSGVDVALQMQDLAVLPVPYFTYQDLSIPLLLEHAESTGGLPAGFEGLDLGLLRARSRRQAELYERAAGVFAMSGWMARHLVERSGLDPARVHVLHPGTNVPVLPRAQPRTFSGSRLLFVGRAFERKGGDLLVRALPLVREQVPGATLTVVGPTSWPMPGAVPDGVQFLGPQGVQEVSRLMSSHDLFVMPSRFEAFGIAPVEARAHGLPVVARAAMAQVETVSPGESGALVGAGCDDPEELAHAVVSVLADDGLRRRCEQDKDAVAAQWSWDRAAGDVLAVTGA